MNDRIRELAQQSKLAELYDRYVEQCMKNADDDILDYDVIVKEFAELIVRECLGISYKESHLPNAILFDERSDKFIKDIHNRIDRATKKHFGVEE